MKFGDFFNTVEKALSAIVADAGLKAVEFKRGKKYVTAAGAPPRIVWVPLQGRAEAPKRQPPAPPGSTTPQGKALYTRNVQVGAHVWAAARGDLDDLGAAEELAEMLVRAVQATFGSSASLVAEDWQAAEAFASQMGDTPVLVFELGVLSYDEVPPTTAGGEGGEIELDPEIAVDVVPVINSG